MKCEVGATGKEGGSKKGDGKVNIHSFALFPLRFTLLNLVQDSTALGSRVLEVRVVFLFFLHLLN